MLISRHTHILASFLFFSFKFLYWEEAWLGLVLVTRGLFFFRPLIHLFTLQLFLN